MIPDRSEFVCHQYSVLNTRVGVWQARRREWLALGITSDQGRGEDLAYTMTGPYAKIANGTSVCDPVLCEMVYRWWSEPGDQIVDPFAGGSVRGIVASAHGHKYWGCDISRTQIKANYTQLSERNTGPHRPAWIVGDANTALEDAPQADLIFSCPPYGDLERYTKRAGDLSRMRREDFIERYRRIINLACQKLSPGKYAVFVVGDYGKYSLATDTVLAFKKAKMRYHTKAILVNNCGTAAIRAANANKHGRLVRVHQEVLVFKKPV